MPEGPAERRVGANAESVDAAEHSAMLDGVMAAGMRVTSTGADAAYRDGCLARFSPRSDTRFRRTSRSRRGLQLAITGRRFPRPQSRPQTLDTGRTNPGVSDPNFARRVTRARVRRGRSRQGLCRVAGTNPDGGRQRAPPVAAPPPDHLSAHQTVAFTLPGDVHPAGRLEGVPVSDDG